MDASTILSAQIRQGGNTQCNVTFALYSRRARHNHAPPLAVAAHHIWRRGATIMLTQLLIKRTLDLTLLTLKLPSSSS